MINLIRQRIEREVINHTGLALGGVNYDQPAGDPGLFGPDAVCWRVHGDFSSMLVGGISALLLQMLHPAALAGVWDHSNFRRDLIGRLRRTGQFIAATTFANTQDANAIIARVRHIHNQVRGQTPYGVDYAATDPHLLTWVHVAEMRSFLTAHLRYLNPSLSTDDQNRYYRETALVARMLGAADVPESVRDIDDYLQAMRNEMVFDARTQDVYTLLQHPPTSNLLTAAFSRCAMLAAIDILPDRARDIYPQTRSWSRRAGGAAIHCAAPVLRWAVRDSSRYRALRRTAQPH